MPSGRGGSSGGHFGGGSFSSGGGHFGGSRGHGAPTPTLGWHGWHHPHVTVFFGRQVYLGAGQAGAVSILSLLLVLSIIVTAFLGINWLSREDDLSTIREQYEYYHNLAYDAVDDDDYQTLGEVINYQQYKASGKYCIFYRFQTASGDWVDDGYSFYVYDYATVRSLKEHGVVLALDTENDRIVKTTDSVPLDYWETTLDDDAEYLDYLSMRNGMRIATFVGLGVIAVMIIAAVMVPLTAKKPTEEQLAASKKENGTTTTATGNQTNNSTVWRCAYCGTMNDSSKNTCDGCGSKRQN